MPSRQCPLHVCLSGVGTIWSTDGDGASGAGYSFPELLSNLGAGLFFVAEEGDGVSNHGAGTPSIAEALLPFIASGAGHGVSDPATWHGKTTVVVGPV